MKDKSDLFETIAKVPERLQYAKTTRIIWQEY